MSAVYGDSCPGKATVYKWHCLFKQGKNSIKDDPRSGQPVESTSVEIVENVEELILEDACLKKKQLAVIVAVSFATVLNILP
ncbi:Putative uncharacterized protein FLJ37770 [Habropoda laboriosa]|uniref:Mos1 transposase HTH domain-containing protein n=1 Tax=Habropoda laboriosa TaxID=597456 RepID=A0A0L7QMD0_9HYME|nr:Putative uncharacterized protein FLJ37770 [Habropoda laboriosa]